MNGTMHNKTKNGHTYIIAEVGQNHNGSLELAKNLIDIAALKIGHGGNIFRADAVKFCKRELSEEMTDEMYNSPYPGKHSYGKTYGEHREALELSYEDHAELFLYAKKRGLDFIETICSPGALQILKWFRPDFIKIASRDLDNYFLLEAVARTKIPIILSMGMISELSEIIPTIFAIEKYHEDISLLHCISQYPAEYNNLCLPRINLLRNWRNRNVIGYSDHTSGVLAPALAVMAGAQIIEKHITFDRDAKGTDHAGSMDISGFERVVRDIRNTELAIAGNWSADCTKGAQDKLRRSVCYKKAMPAGCIIGKDDLAMLSPGTGIKPKDYKIIIGKVLKCNVQKNTLVKFEDFYE